MEVASLPSLSGHLTDDECPWTSPPSIGEIPPSGMHIYVMLSSAFLAIFFLSCLDEDS